MNRELVFAISEDYAPLTGGWVYDTRLIDELARLGWTVTRLSLPAGFPMPDAAARAKTDAILAVIPDGTTVISDQLCLSVVPELVRRHAGRLRLVTIVHHPLALEAGYAADVASRLYRDEKEALSLASCAIATSRSTAARLMQDYAVPASKVIVAPPGIDRLPRSPGGSCDGSGLALLSVGAVVPRKGYELALEALAGLGELGWHLVIVGDCTRNPAYVARLARMIADADLSRRVTLAGGLAQADLDRLWSDADIYLASSHHEGYGMAVAEAIARGLPVVTTDAGTIGDWLPPDAAIIVHERSAEALRAALRQVIAEPALRRRLADAARAHAATFLDWPAVARIVAERLADLGR